ncbi:hypothetical protein, partial [Mycobacterium tuberculosis]|uniref:hypothetical protein n=1 Tax=Mycobacterium tuberculosis TaxID=1773 RepID=UPI00214EE28B
MTDQRKKGRRDGGEKEIGGEERGEKEEKGEEEGREREDGMRDGRREGREESDVIAQGGYRDGVYKVSHGNDREVG